MEYWKLFICLHVFIKCCVIECITEYLTDFDMQVTLEREILSLMGFPEVPKNPDKIPNRKRSAPKYMMTIYMNDQDESLPKSKSYIASAMISESDLSKIKLITPVVFEPSQSGPIKSEPNRDKPVKMQSQLDEDEEMTSVSEINKPIKLESKLDETEEMIFGFESDETESMTSDEFEPGENIDEDEPMELQPEPDESQSLEPDAESDASESISLSEPAEISSSVSEFRPGKQLFDQTHVEINFEAINPHKGGKPDHVRRMWFDIDNAPEDENLIYAELKLFRATKELEIKLRDSYRIVVQRVYRDKKNQNAFEEVNSVITKANFEGWISINVTCVVDYWIKNPRENRGLRILVFPVREANRRVTPEFVGIVGFNGEANKQPFIAGYYKNKNHYKAQPKEIKPMTPSPTPAPRLNKNPIHKGDVKINFEAINPYKESKPDHVRKMWFDNDNASLDGKLTYAEFKLYRTTKGLERKFRDSYRIIIQRIYYDKNNQKAFDEVNSVVTKANFEGWISINVTRAVNYWLENPGENHGFKILVLPTGREGRPVTPELVGIVGFNGEADKQPFIAGYYKNKNHNKDQPEENKSMTPSPTPAPGFNDNPVHKDDIMINFEAINPHKGGKPDHVRRMWFDIENAPMDDKLTYAELKLYRTTKGLERKFRNSYRIVVQRIYHDKNNQKAFDEVNSVITKANFEGWISINVTRAVNYWLDNPRENRGFKIMVFPVGRASRRVNPEFTGIVGFNGEADKQPFIAGYYKNKNHNNSKSEKTTSTSSPFSALGIDKNLIHKSDVIISFMAINPFKGGKPDHVQRMWFDISGTTEDDLLTHAELKLYRITKGLKRKFRDSYRIVVQRVYHNENNQNAFEEVNSVITKANFEGWISINVTQAVDYWIKNPKENRGLKILVLPTGDEGRRVNPEFTGIVGFNGEADKQPFIAGFYKNINYNKIQLKLEHLFKRFKRSSDLLSFAAIAKFQSKEEATIVRNPSACSRKFYHVSFKDIRWHEWIIAPEGYDAYYCDGRCDFPLSKRTNPTNHAIIQSALQAIRPDLVPKPCCAPTKLSPLSILYFMDNNNVVYRKYRNMVVNDCGCQ